MGNKKLAKALNKRIDATRSVLAGRAVNLQKQIDRISLDVEPVIEEHHAREERRERAMAAHRRRRADGWEPPYARLRRRVDRIEEGQKKRAAYNSIDHSGMKERLDNLELAQDAGDRVRIRTLELGRENDRERLEALERFQRRVVGFGYAFGLFAGIAAIYFVGQALGALCQ